MHTTDPPTTRLLDDHVVAEDDTIQRVTKKKSFTLRYTVAGLCYVVTLSGWLGGAFPFDQNWTNRFNQNFSVIVNDPKELLIYLASGLGASVFPFIGVLIYRSMLKVKSEHRHAKIAIIVGIVMIVVNLTGSLGA